MSIKLTPNSISAIIGGEKGLKPFVQVLDIQPFIPNPNSKIKRHRLVISDSVSTQKAFLASNLEDRLETGQIGIGSVLQILSYACISVGIRKIVVIMEVEINVPDCDPNPKHFSDSANSGTQRPEIEKVQQNASCNSTRIFDETEKLKSELDNQKKDLETHLRELKKRESHYQSEMRKLIEEQKKAVALNTSLEMASSAQQEASKNVLKLSEVQKKEKDDLNVKHDLELEIVHLKGKLNVIGYMSSDKDCEAKKLRTIILEKEGELEKAREKLNNELEARAKKLLEKEEELENLESLNQALLVMERKSNFELQEARTFLISLFKDLPRRQSIGVKRMGELESKLFHESRKRNIRAKDGDLDSVEICSMWEGYISDPAWHPFKVINTNDGHKEIIDKEDEKLKGLEKEYKDEVYEAVVKALMEMNEYNSSGRFVVPELWNFKEDRRASLKEGIEKLANQCKTSKRSRRR